MAVIITPEPGRHKEIGQLLLALADGPHQVQWATWPAAGFSVPEELFAKFVAAGEDPETVAQTLWQMPQEQLEKLAEEPPAPKRRGRPRKEASTDNTNSEEE